MVLGPVVQEDGATKTRAADEDVVWGSGSSGSSGRGKRERRKDRHRQRPPRFTPETATFDKGYDTEPIHSSCGEHGVLPIIPLKKTPAVVKGEHKPPTCEHGEWTFAGADYKRKLTKWRCPLAAGSTGKQLELLACSPASVWVKASRLHPLVPRDSKRWGDLYRGRGSVERAFGRLKNEYGLKPLRVRGKAKVALHADLCILATLARARAVPLAA